MYSVLLLYEYLYPSQNKVKTNIDVGLNEFL